MYLSQKIKILITVIQNQNNTETLNFMKIKKINMYIINVIKKIEFKFCPWNFAFSCKMILRLSFILFLLANLAFNSYVLVGQSGNFFK